MKRKKGFSLLRTTSTHLSARRGLEIPGSQTLAASVADSVEALSETFTREALKSRRQRAVLFQRNGSTTQFPRSLKMMMKSIEWLMVIFLQCLSIFEKFGINYN